MNGSNQNDIWQVEVNGEVYTAALPELSEWINEGSLHPADKVRKGNLRWMEAGRVPQLLPFFNARSTGQAPPVVTITQPEPVPPAHVVNTAENSEPGVPIAPLADESPSRVRETPQTFDEKVCAVHEHIESVYVCGSCGAGLCKSCPKSFGGAVKLCSLCGQLCRERIALENDRSKQLRQDSAQAEGFGLGDVARSFRYPLRFGTTLLFGGLMFAALGVGQLAVGLGGVLMIFSGLICLMLANTLAFGVVSNTVERFASGDLDENFMPSFGDFSVWEDVVHPFLLSIAAYIVSFGPFLAAMAIGLYLVFSSIGSDREAFESEIKRLPGTPYYAGREPADQSLEVKKVLTETAAARDKQVGDPSAAASANTTPFVDQESRDQEALWAEVTDARRAQFDPDAAAAASERELSDVKSRFLTTAPPVVVVCGLLFIWGLFMFPAAVSVAAYTRSFVATIDPTVSLDTIKRLGVGYIKLVAITILLLVISIVAGGIFATLLSPLDLPRLGNIPATFLTSFVSFYLIAVFAAVLGYALYKSAGKLKLTR
jgi:hypothetical protein